MQNRLKNKAYKKVGINPQEEKWLLSEKYGGKQTKAFFQDLKRLQTGEPIDYIIGTRPFLGARIDLSEKPLIPRPETEYWVEKAIQTIKREKRGKKRITILDTCAGSGCIGIAIAHALPHAYVYFGDTYTSAVRQIKKNLRLNRIPAARTRVVTSNLFSKVPHSKRFDYIVANPPYLSVNRKQKIQPSVLRWEPHTALFAARDGLATIYKIIDELPPRLAANGKAFIEIDSRQKPAVATYIGKRTSLSVSFWKDQYGKWRVVVVENKSHASISRKKHTKNIV